jgi:hypothetical protein
MTDGGSSIAVAVDNVAVGFVSCDVTASDAADGADGTPPTGAAMTGGNASCQRPSRAEHRGPPNATTERYPPAGQVERAGFRAMAALAMAKVAPTDNRRRAPTPIAMERADRAPLRLRCANVATTETSEPTGMLERRGQPPTTSSRLPASLTQPTPTACQVL